jgi:hypothetical protein
MPLTCSCGDWGDFDEWHFGAVGDDYMIMLDFPKRKRCASCGDLIDSGSLVTKFQIARRPKNDIEERIYGDGEEGVPKAPKYLCERCSDIYFNLEALGFCVGPYEDLRETLKDYQHEYGEKR